MKQIKSHDKGRTFRVIVEKLEELGYFVHTAALNALHFGLLQKRERTFFVGFKQRIIDQ